MAIVVADRVQETTTTTGTGTINLAGASVQYQTFVSGIGSGNQTYYCITSGNNSDWEVGIGTVTSGSPATLSRTTILASTNSNAAINLSGASTVFATNPACLAYGAPLVKPPLLASWTQRNISAPATAADSPLGPVLTDNFGAGPRFRVLSVASPLTPYTIDAMIAVDTCWTNFTTHGLGWTDGTKYQIILMCFSGNPQFRVANFNSTSSFNSDATTAQNWFINPTAVWFRINDDGTNVNYYHSADGLQWNLRYSVAKSSGFLGATGYTNVCVVHDPEGTAQGGTTQNTSLTLRSWWQH